MEDTDREDAGHAGKEDANTENTGSWDPDQGQENNINLILLRLFLNNNTTYR